MVHRMKCFEYAHPLTQRNFFLNSFSADTSTLRESSLRSNVIHNSAQNETNQYCKSTVVFHWSGCAVFPSLFPFRWQIWPVQVPCDTSPIHLLPPRPMFWPSFDRIELGSVDHNLNRLFLSHRGIRAKSNNGRSSRIRSICLLRTLPHWIHLLPPQQHWWWSTNNIRTRQLCCRLPMHHQRRIMLSMRNVIVISRDDIFFFFPRSIYIYMNIKLYQWWIICVRRFSKSLNLQDGGFHSLFRQESPRHLCVVWNRRRWWDERFWLLLYWDIIPMTGRKLDSPVDEFDAEWHSVPCKIKWNDLLEKRRDKFDSFQFFGGSAANGDSLSLQCLDTTVCLWQL